MVRQTDTLGSSVSVRNIGFASPFFPQQNTLNGNWLGLRASSCKTRYASQLRFRNQPSFAGAAFSRCCVGSKSDRSIVTCRTMEWARVIVCGLGLCPFAQAVLDDNTVRLNICDSDDELEVTRTVQEEARILGESSVSEISTTLLVLPKFAPRDFIRYYNYCQFLETLFEEDERYADEVMLACFHPEHRWLDSHSPDEAINFDKRAPYPIINLLRAEEVDRYIIQGKTQNILERNKVTLEKLGSEHLKEMYRSLGSNCGT